MLDELRSASDALNAALDRYLDICTSIRQHYCKGDNNVSRDLEGLSLIANEVLLITSFKTKIHQADAAISLVRNTMPTVVPINALPEEILSRIFHLVTYGEPCKFHHTYEYPAYPTLLTHVCSRWRQAAINSPTLWSHIDLSSHGFRGSGEPHERHLAHAKTYLARAGQAQLDIHVAEDFPHGLYVHDVRISDFLIPLASRMRSLEIHIELESDNRPDAYKSGYTLCDDILSCCLIICTPGTLKHLMIAPKGDGNGSFIQSRDVPEDTIVGDWSPKSTLDIDMKEQELEGLLFPITRLRLSGRFPHWSSRAYHGLTELRLYPHGSITRIPDFQFTTMLAESPQLEIFEFGLDIDRSVSRPPPVHMNNLRVLVINTDALNAFLPLIALGPQPIAVSLTKPRSLYLTGRTLVKKHPQVGPFLSSCNITDFYARDFETLLEISYLVDSMPNLRTLALNIRDAVGHLDARPEERLFASRISLDILYLVGQIQIHYDNLVIMLKEYHVKKLVLGWDFAINSDIGFGLVTRKDVEEEMTDLGVDVEFYSPLDTHPTDYFGHTFASYESSLI
ncbi:F-box-like domain protein, putative, partial [Rhizoctonia solani AG-3 Rhs1AP]